LPCVIVQLSKEKPALDDAIRNGKEVIDYKVESALLKAALGGTTTDTKETKETKVNESERQRWEPGKNGFGNSNQRTHAEYFGLPDVAFQSAKGQVETELG
jgi:hypothetical protein